VDEWAFFLYESTYFSGVSTTSGGRRLLVVKPTNKAPATACSKGCCKPVKPLPKTCKPSAGKKIYPACIKTLVAFANERGLTGCAIPSVHASFPFPFSTTAQSSSAGRFGPVQSLLLVTY